MSAVFHASGGQQAVREFAGGLHARNLLDAMPQAMVATDSAGRACYFNAAAEELIAGRLGGFCGCAPEELLTMLDLDSGVPLSELVRRCLHAEEGRHAAGEALLPRERDASAPVGFWITPVRGVDGEIDGALMVLGDVTDSDVPGARRDGSPGHASTAPPVDREAFEHRLERALRTVGRSETHVLLHLNLNRDREAAKACGSAAADALRHRGYQQIAALIRQRDTLASLGSAEFGLLMEHCPLERAVDRAHQIHGAMGGQALRWAGMSFKLDVNIGIVPLRGRTQGAAALLALASEAARAARDDGSNGVCVLREASARQHMAHAREGEWREYIRQVLY